jgi:hypothetical protein
MTKTATATTEAQIDIEAAIGRLSITPSAVTVNSRGFGWTDFMVRLPEGFTADDLKEPDVWRGVQGQPGVAMRFPDKVRLIAFDETWVAEAMVTQADADSITLAVQRIDKVAGRRLPLPDTEDYRVKWYGNGYGVERKSDGHKMRDTVATIKLAQAEMAALYPRPI